MCQPARIKKKQNIKLEIFLRKHLCNNVFRYRVKYKELAGSLDMYLPKYKTAIFVNRCSYHMQENCKYSFIPRSNYDFWKNKLEGNVERDKQNYSKLKNTGIKVIAV